MFSAGDLETGLKSIFYGLGLSGEDSDSDLDSDNRDSTAALILFWKSELTSSHPLVFN